jgi:hypothetical protein
MCTDPMPTVHRQVLPRTCLSGIGIGNGADGAIAEHLACKG